MRTFIHVLKLACIISLLLHVCSIFPPRRKRARRPPKRRKDSPPIAVLSNMVVGTGGHLAVSHDDTTDGAIHWFQDESGELVVLKGLQYMMEFKILGIL